jgi:hypothetical protein
MKRARTASKYVVCIENVGCEDLALNKIYEVLADASAAKDDYIRVRDESGEDYLYPGDYFIPIRLPQRVEKSFGPRLLTRTCETRLL